MSPALGTKSLAVKSNPLFTLLNLCNIIHMELSDNTNLCIYINAKKYFFKQCMWFESVFDIITQPRILHLCSYCHFLRF